MLYEIGEREGQPTLLMRAGKGSSSALRETAEWALDACCREVARKAGISVDEVRFFAITTPVAWYSDFSARLLGYTAEQTWNSHPVTANTGPILMPQNLFFGAKHDRIRRGANVLLHTVGSVSSAGAAILRWGNVALGPEPDPPTLGE
jgi:3-oxoacyl-[acyl-carrier-protein] synthase-3